MKIATIDLVSNSFHGVVVERARAVRLRAVAR
jgi:exopolyphosphatase/pppGpp-phosphohydrolase